MRVPDWAIYLAAFGLIGWAVFTSELTPGDTAHGGLRSPRRPIVVTPPRDVSPLPERSEGRVIVQLDREVRPGSGTAFAIDQGLWLTARHVVDGCAQVAVVNTRNQGIRARRVQVDRRTDLALVSLPAGRTPPLALDLDRSLNRNQRAYMIGYPQGRPGEVVARLIGRETLVVRGRYRTEEPVLAWAEERRTRGLRGSLGGLSGGPAFDASGAVIGVTVAESPRRGRVYTAAPESLRRFLNAPPPGEGFGAVDPNSVVDQARALRRSGRVARVACLT
ncbi:MAG: serine protease [Maricaulaceae bacterium]